MPVKIPFDAPPSEQIAAARSQRVILPDAFYRLPAEKRAQAFAISGLARLDQVQRVADEFARMQAEGGTLAEFQKWAKTQDWSLPRHRLETVYRNAVQQSYNAGHWRRFEETAADRPYLMYDAINDSRVRPSHLALDGVIKPVGDAYWNTHSPQLGQRCRCVLRSLDADEAREKGGVTQNPPAEGVADKGWGAKPTDGFAGVRQAVDGRLSKCPAMFAASVTLARRLAVPLWCHDGPARDLLLMQKAWAARSGAMPSPRPVNLPLAEFTDHASGLALFMERVGGDRVTLPSGDVVHPGDDLFRSSNGASKIQKRNRGQWLLYLAELIKRPQEIWRLDLAMSQELYLLGRFLRGNQRVDTIAVLKRDGDDGEWSDGKTAYVFDSSDGLLRKRRELMADAQLRWMEV